MVHALWIPTVSGSNGGNKVLKFNYTPPLHSHIHPALVVLDEHISFFNHTNNPLSYAQVPVIFTEVPSLSVLPCFLPSMQGLLPYIISRLPRASYSQVDNALSAYTTSAAAHTAQRKPTTSTKSP